MTSKPLDHQDRETEIFDVYELINALGNLFDALGDEPIDASDLRGIGTILKGCSMRLFAVLESIDRERERPREKKAKRRK